MQIASASGYYNDDADVTAKASVEAAQLDLAGKQQLKSGMTSAAAWGFAGQAVSAGTNVAGNLLTSKDDPETTPQTQKTKSQPTPPQDNQQPKDGKKVYDAWVMDLILKG